MRLILQPTRVFILVMIKSVKNPSALHAQTGKADFLIHDDGSLTGPGFHRK